MRRLRILHIITRLIVGGAQEDTLFTVIGLQDDPSVEVTLLSGIDDGPEGTLHADALAAGVNLQFLPEMVRPIDPVRDSVVLAKLVSFIRKGHYDIVHTHSSKAGILGRIAATLAGVPIRVHTLHSLVFGEHATSYQNRLYIGAKRICAPMTDQFISVCDATRLGAIAAGIGKPEQHLTIYSGFPIQPFLEVRNNCLLMRRSRGSAWSPEHRLWARSLVCHHRKVMTTSCAAAEVIATTDPRVHFLLVGDGALRPQLEKQVSALGLSDRFVFAGLVAPTDVPRYMQAMDVVVHTSIREGLAIVLPQASAVGKPIVGFALDGTPEALGDGERGLLARPYDSLDVAHKTLALLE